MDLTYLQTVCSEIFGVRGSGGGQEATGAVGHVKGGPLSVNDRKILYLARQGGPSVATVTTTKYHSTITRSPPPRQVVTIVQQAVTKTRDAIDCREYAITYRRKSEWTGYHAEMIIVSAWLNFLFANGDGMSTQQLRSYRLDYITTQFAARFGNSAMIAANADCCTHCHNLLTHLGIQHPVPNTPTTSLTAWWNPLRDTVHANGSLEFRDPIPGL